MILNEPYSKELFDGFLKDFLPDYQKDERQVRTPDKSILTEVTQLGLSREVNVTVLEAECEETDTNKRIAITQAAFKVLRDHGIRNAIIAFHDGADQWRLSLLTSTLEIKDGKVIKKDSNPRRYSYLLGVGAKTVTPYKYLIEKGRVENIKQLQERFSVEVVNKQFYASIAELFTKLIGGERGVTKHPGLLKLNGSVNQNVEHQEFAVRLIGRVIFSWFLKEKKSKAGVPIVPNELLSLDAIASNADYYHSILEPLFFELLNKRVEQRHENLRETPFSTVPYLNGGLFSPQYNDYYNQSSYNGAGTPGLTHIPDSWFSELFTILEQYNFTVDENTSYDVDLSIDPEMLGRIFENLLAEINPETGETARKSTGSFYTPREIVDYMVDSSLLEFLRNSTGIDEVKLRALVSWGKDDDEQHPLMDDENEKIVKALASLTILDPACGSGAFPIGILQKVVYVLQQVDEKAELWLQNQLKSITSPELRRDIEEKYRNENYDYLRKLGVIRESIFGVDIQTIATEISKLRCFLTLIIEEDVDDSALNRGIRPLPNLDFKFVTANSLIGLPENNKSGKLNLFEDTSHIDRLKEIRNRYFGADADERNRLQIEFKDLQHAMLKSRIMSGGGTSDLYNILSDWNPFAHDKTEWFDSEWMFGVNSFDLVIANPPYVGEKGNKAIFDSLKQTNIGKRFYKGKMDLFYFFFHLGLDALKDGGVLTFITTNYYPTADGAIKLRKDFYERTNMVRLINFGEITVFDSARGQHNLITILQRSVAPSADYKTEEIVASNKGSVSSGALNNVLSGDSELVSVSKVTKQGVYDSVGNSFYIRFVTGNVAGDGVIKKMIQAGKPLSGYADTREGLHTGIDTISEKDSIKFSEYGYKKGENVFVIQKGKYRFPHLRPWFKSSDIEHYTANELNESEVLYLNSRDEPTTEELSYLQKYKPLLENRSEFKAGTKKIWYELKRPRVRSMFEQEKIVNPYRSKDNFFALVRTPWFASADVFYTVSKSPQLSNTALCAILNSKLIRYWLMNRGKRKGGMMELKSTPIGEIPLVMPTEDIEAKLSSLVNEIISLRTGNPNEDISVQEAEINKIVYQLYNLTPEEIAIVEGQK